MSVRQTKVLGIAGGSGSGKTTVAIYLHTAYPGRIALLHLDDYYKKPEDVPTVGGRRNWDHPDSLMFDELTRDIELLTAGNPVTIMTKSELYNPHYDPRLRNMIQHVVEPADVIIVEGYLAFYDERVRDQMTLKIYLDIPIAESLKRRKKLLGDQWYLEQVVIPTHEEFVVPTKCYADVVIDIKGKDTLRVEQEVEALIKPWLDAPGQKQSAIL